MFIIFDFQFLSKKEKKTFYYLTIEYSRVIKICKSLKNFRISAEDFPNKA